MDFETLLAELMVPIRCESGEERISVRNAPASEPDIAALLARLPRPLTGSYLGFLRATNGMSLYGTTLFGTTPPAEADQDRVADRVSRRLVPFHDWGNGDFDCLDLTKIVDDEPPVVFWNDHHDNLFPIAHSFAKWIPMAVHEISRFGRLLHPRDYYEGRYENAQGLYESIANVERTFFGGPEVKGRVESAPPPEGRRARLKAWLGAFRR